MVHIYSSLCRTIFTLPVCVIFISFYITCVCRDRLGTHEHTVSTERLHLGLVLLAWLQPRHSVVGNERGALQRPLVVNSEHGDGRGVPHVPAQGVVVGAKRCLTQGPDAGVN